MMRKGKRPGHAVSGDHTQAPAPEEMREIQELFSLLDALQDIMPVDVERGTIGLNVRTAEDAERVAAAMVKAKALHNKLVGRGKIAGTIIP